MGEEEWMKTRRRSSMGEEEWMRIRLADVESIKEAKEQAEKERVKYVSYIDCWETLREYLLIYKKERSVKGDSEAVYGRYCVSISIEDLLEKMDEIEGK